MILRRLAEGIREQNWFTVVLEIFIVVTGIFIGLQMDDWNQQRIDRADGLFYLERLHNDILLTEQMADRLRTRRLTLILPLSEAADVLFDPTGQAELTEEHCFALATSSYHNINVSGLPSLAELMSTGRVAIIRDVNLRNALVRLQQNAEMLRGIINFQTAAGNNLPKEYPDLINSLPIFDEALGERQSSYRCDLIGMRANHGFLNNAAENVDAYDFYLRDGLVPWSDQLNETHNLVDRALSIDHAN